jgi:hypothetical protein
VPFHIRFLGGFLNESLKGEVMNKKTVLMILLGIMVAAAPSFGGDIPGDVKAGFDKAGLKIYPGAVYCTGQLEWGVRFATSDSPEKVMQWYQEQYPQWSVQDKYDLWTFYDGPPDQGPGFIMGVRNLFVKFTAEVPGWHGLAADMTTEITMAAP